MNSNSEQLFNIITQLPSALLILSPEFKIVHASQSYLRVTVTERHLIVGKNIFDAFPVNPHDEKANGVKNLKASLKKALQTLEPQKMPVQKYDIPLADGGFQEKYWDVINVPVIGEQGQVEHIIHSVIDVTARVKSEAALELAVGAAELGTWEIDLMNDSFGHRNPRHDRIYGYNEPQPIWSHTLARKKILDEDLIIYDGAFAEAVKAGNINFEVRTRWEDGSIHWVEVKGQVYYASNGKATKAAGVNIDVTEQRLTEKALKQAKEKAEAAARAKDEFLSTMSHEIRTPLNAVIGISNLLLDEGLTESQRANLDSLHFAAENLLHLVNNVLDFSKIQAGKIEVNEEVFNLFTLINDIIQAHKARAIEKDIKLTSHFGQDVPKRVCSDPFLLTQILHNLVGNALKFTNKGSISVSVEFVKEEDEEGFIRFNVEDTGEGIAADKLDYIFEKFAQMRNFAEGNYEGTGLGLPITKSLVKLLGGDIEAKSSPGKGSKFYFTIPTSEASLCTAEEAQAKGEQEEVEDFEQKQILLVEDVEINRNIILQYLRKWWNLEPDEAENGEQALEMVRRKKYDLILMDLRMPVMNGYEASRKIRELQDYKEIPVLAFTADTRENLKDSHIFEDTIFKPFEPADLKSKIIKYLIGGEEGKRSEQAYENDDKGGKRTSSFDIKRYTKMANGKPKMLKKFIATSIKGIEQYREDFRKADNEAILSDLVHRNTMLVYYINARNLKAKIEKFRINLAGKEQTQIQVEKKEILAEFDIILKGLKSAIDSNAKA